MQSHKVIASLTTKTEIPAFAAESKTAPESTEQALTAELCDALLIMLEEAGTRSSASDACTVIKGILASLQQDYPEISSLAKTWQLLVSDTKPAPVALIIQRA
jgi:hypothetical protein